MQTFPLRRPVAAFFCVLALGACSRADNPFERLENPPVMQADLRGVTLVSAEPSFGEKLPDMGYEPLSFAANYPGTVRVHALMWQMPEPVVTAAREFRSPGAKPQNATLLVAPLPTPPPAADAALVKSFYRNVLGSEVPVFPPKGRLPADVRVQAWTFVVPKVLDASRKLREKNIAVVFNPVAMSSPMFGDHKVIAIRAPDGVLVELVELAAN
jgi:hypothetical protein